MKFQGYFSYNRGMTYAAPLTDADAALLLAFLSTGTGTGRPPADRRRTLAAIFHVVLTRCIWPTFRRIWASPTRPSASSAAGCAPA